MAKSKGIAGGPKLQDLTGQRFGKLVVVSRGEDYVRPSTGRHAAKWNCVCDCGASCCVIGEALKRGLTKSCGCVRKQGPKIDNLVGLRFGKLTVISLAERKSYGSRSVVTWECLCDCGKMTRVSSQNIRQGQVKSCGCFAKEATSKRMTKHGLSNTPEYEAWTNMNGRCKGRGLLSKKNYENKGIRVCQRYESDFVSFYEDMHPRPSEDHSIDRIDNTRGYDCGHPDCADCTARGATRNVRWATWTEQMRNTSRNHHIIHNGDKITVAELGERLGVSYTEAYKIAKSLPQPETPEAGDSL